MAKSAALSQDMSSATWKYEEAVSEICMRYYERQGEYHMQGGRNLL
jgi:hypothetical protein